MEGLVHGGAYFRNFMVFLSVTIKQYTLPFLISFGVVFGLLIF